MPYKPPQLFLRFSFGFRFLRLLILFCLPRPQFRTRISLLSPLPSSAAQAFPASAVAFTALGFSGQSCALAGRALFPICISGGSDYCWRIGRRGLIDRTAHLSHRRSRRLHRTRCTLQQAGAVGLPYDDFTAVLS